MPFQIWALGSNGNGQLGIGNRDDVPTPTRCLFQPSLPQSKLWSRPLRTISGGNHTFLLTENRYVYACGQNDDGRCGLIPQATVTSFERVGFTAERPGRSSRLINKFDHVAATWSSTMFVTWNDEAQETEMYSCGTGDFGELALGAGRTRNESPTFVAAFKERVINMAASARHIVIVFENGVARGCGSGRFGQLGDIPAEVTPAGAPPISIWTLENLPTFNDMQDGRPIAAYRIACGLRFTVILARTTFVGCGYDAKIWLLGCNGKHDKFNLRQHISDAKLDSDHVVGISACWSTVHFELRHSTTISCGRGDKGQRAPDSFSPPLPLSDVRAGSEHAIAGLSTRDGVIMWGWGEHGNCGPIDANGQLLGDKDHHIIEGKDLAEAKGFFPLGAGCATTFFATFDT